MDFSSSRCSVRCRVESGEYITGLLFPSVLIPELKASFARENSAKQPGPGATQATLAITPTPRPEQPPMSARAAMPAEDNVTAVREDSVREDSVREDSVREDSVREDSVRDAIVALVGSLPLDKLSVDAVRQVKALRAKWKARAASVLFATPVGAAVTPVPATPQARNVPHLVLPAPCSNLLRMKVEPVAPVIDRLMVKAQQRPRGISDFFAKRKPEPTTKAEEVQGGDDDACVIVGGAVNEEDGGLPAPKKKAAVRCPVCDAAIENTPMSVNKHMDKHFL